jgi:sterol 3beta-glucosyltransferase
MGKEVADVVREGDTLLTIETGSNLTNGIVEKFHLRVIHINMQPFFPTREFPAMGVPEMPTWMPMRGAYNRLTYELVRRGGWSMLGQSGNQLRTEYLGLAKQTLAKHKAMLDATPSLLLVSRHVIPPADDWQSYQRVTGYVFDEDSTWEASQDLLNFLADGEKPIYCGFGSMRLKQPEATTRLLLEAVQRTGKRAVILGGWAGIGKTDLPKNVFLLKYAPHTWLFQRMAAVIHHGGAGTTAAAMRAGVPSIIIPILADQPYWGQRVYELGIGTKPIPRGKLTVDSLTAAIQEATTNHAMRNKGAELSQKIAAEDGVSEAVNAIKSFLN